MTFVFYFERNGCSRFAGPSCFQLSITSTLRTQSHVKLNSITLGMCSQSMLCLFVGGGSLI
jgi:hypothetical protein